MTEPTRALCFAKPRKTGRHSGAPNHSRLRGRGSNDLGRRVEFRQTHDRREYPWLRNRIRARQGHGELDHPGVGDLRLDLEERATVRHLSDVRRAVTNAELFGLQPQTQCRLERPLRNDRSPRVRPFGGSGGSWRGRSWSGRLGFVGVASDRNRRANNSIRVRCVLPRPVRSVQRDRARRPIARRPTDVNPNALRRQRPIDSRAEF